MFGAELSEVWDDYKPKKKKKKDKPLTPNEMDSGLLIQNEDKKLIQNERERLSSLVDDRDINYRYERIRPNNIAFENPYGYRYESVQENSRRPARIEDDPDYKEFLEFKKNKNISNINVSKRNSDRDTEKEINELILYIFTGIFLLVLYDNIYQLGKKSY